MKKALLVLIMLGLMGCGTTRVLVKKDSCQDLAGTALLNCELEQEL